MHIPFGKRSKKRLTHLLDLADRALFLQGQTAARNHSKKAPIRDLSEAEFRVYSQFGEDGIIEWLVSHVEVPNTRFVEFGVEDFREANCRFLLRHRKWRGFVIDGSESNVAALRSEALYWMTDLTAKAAFVTAENINSLIAEAGFGGPLGLLSIDIDGNDYWVWNAIERVDPAIVSCEYNAVLGDTRAIVVPYDASFERHKSHTSGVYFGASILALCHLAEKKGYAFVGTSSNGINAFFVKRELAGNVLRDLSEVRAFPSQHRESRNANRKLTFVGGPARLQLIADMPVIDVTTGKTHQLLEIEQPYSETWLRVIS